MVSDEVPQKLHVGAVARDCTRLVCCDWYERSCSNVELASVGDGERLRAGDWVSGILVNFIVLCNN